MVIRGLHYGLAVLLATFVASSCEGPWERTDYQVNPCSEGKVEPDACGDGVCHAFMDVDDVCASGVPQACVEDESKKEDVDGCGDMFDNDCDGTVNENCPCKIGDPPKACYGGSAATRDVGLCKSGTQKCGEDLYLADCEGDVLPVVEVCDGFDNDCDGVIDERCPCTDKQTQGCYSGSKGVMDDEGKYRGICKAGTQTCTNGFWGGPCVGEQLPREEICNQQDDDCNGSPDDGVKQAEVCDGIDNDCNGAIDDDFPEKDQACDTPYLGPCKPGIYACEDGERKCVSIFVASKEVCDGIDNDCSGFIDDKEADQPKDCSLPLEKGECRKGKTECTGGGIQCNKRMDVPSDELCNNLDDDCDGDVDENNPQGGAYCDAKQAGICKDGVEVCEAGEIVCKSLLPPTVETCNGKDDNCDGNVDEGAPGSGVDCTVPKPGQCQFGKTQCTDGALACVQTIQPVAEMCNSKDDDCDGAIDNGNPGGGADCFVSGVVGECKFGKTICGPGGTIVCQQVVFPLGGELCNNKDDDCDGVVDEGNPGGNLACVTGELGVCAPGQTTCSMGTIACEPLENPSAEICDGKDNDCDGVVDDNPQQVGAACMTGQPGPCAPGKWACTSGTLECISNVPAALEVCDGVDNNCNGVVDDNAAQVGTACSTGKPGPCAAGTYSCTNGALKCNQTTPSSNEVCDGIDNDCNGVVDDNAASIGNACTTGQQGACAAGAIACDAGMLVCHQTTFTAPEVCDNVDNNCNGVIDDNASGTGDPCTTGLPGECNAGSKVCVAGGLICQKLKQPTAELCDGLDNDCDGQSDEGNPEGNASCTATGAQGECRNGKTQCQSGSLICVASTSVAEVCDGKDNDCDGLVDDSPLQVGTACTTPKLGECAPGTNQCIGGALTCSQIKLPVNEICDGKDNDCNGQVDDNVAQVGSACVTGNLGECAGGTYHCTSGILRCDQTNQISGEQCDGKDNDCDGQIDENVPGIGAACTTNLPGPCAPGKMACENGASFCKPNTAPSTEMCDSIDQDCDGFSGTSLLDEDFTTPSGWTITGSGAGWEIWQALTNSYNDPPDDTTPANSDRRLAGVQVNYLAYPNSSGELTHAAITISPVARVHLQMQAWVDSDDGEMLHVLEVKDNTTPNWSSVATFTHSPAWNALNVDLYPYINPLASSFQFRFRFQVGQPSNNHGGMSIDDVKIYDDACVP